MWYWEQLRMIVELEIAHYFMQVLWERCFCGWLVFYTCKESGAPLVALLAYIWWGGYTRSSKTENGWGKVTKYALPQRKTPKCFQNLSSVFYDGHFYTKLLILLFCAQTNMPVCQIIKTLADSDCQGRLTGKTTRNGKCRKLHLSPNSDESHSCVK